MELSVAIVTPQPHTSHALQRALSPIPGLESRVIMLEPDIAIRSIGRADVVLLHNALSTNTVLRLLRTLLLVPGTTMPVVVDAPDDPDTLVEYLEHGAVGYVLAGEPPERLIEVVTGVAEGKAFIDPRIATRLIERYRQLRQRLRYRHAADNDVPRRQSNRGDD